MTYDEMNAFILNYIKNDITGRATMLTGDWGSGKSYYVKNTLKPFLEDKDNGKYRCVIVSLYGFSDISEISKAIYMELRTIKKSPSSETVSTAKVVGKIVGKTIFNGLVSKIGFDIGGITDNDLQEVYESVDLTDKLIVLEDIERTQIDIIELLGYINSMCENDGAKVLLVTNEIEILTTYEKTDEQGKTIKYYTDSAIAYKRVKEKTVGDTICFFCDYENTIKQIIKTFGISLKNYNSSENATDIRDIFILIGSHNLRAFIYGCQKSKNIFEFIDNNNISINDNIKKIIFYGIIAFTQRQSKGENLQFDEGTYISAKLGLNEQYPLFRFCYNFIVFQIIVKDEIKNSIVYYTEYCRNGKWNSGRDKDLQILKEFHIRTEKEVADSILNIPKKLIDGDIPYYDYGVLINYLVAIKFEFGIDFNIESIERVIIDNLKNADENIEFEALFYSRYELHNDTAINEFNTIKQKIKDALNETDELAFPYEPEKVNDFCSINNIRKLKETVNSKGFAQTLDINRFIELLKKCTSAQISTIRSLFLNLYLDPFYNQITEDDKFALKELRKKLPTLQEFEQYDKIQKMQIFWFNKNLNDIIRAFEIQMTQGE